MQKNDFLIEIQTEELPPKFLHSLAKIFLENIKTLLQKASLEFEGGEYFGTPRRLAVLINQLNLHQPDKIVERKGPQLDKAFDAEGKPTQACIGFARSCGIAVSELITLAGNVVGYKQRVAGKTIFELLPAIVEEALNGLPIAKPMRWGNHTQKFIRPVRSVVMLYGDKIIDAEILGCKAGNKTRGHRFLHSDKWVEILSANQYEKTLVKAFVIPNFFERKQKIASQISECVHHIPEKNIHALVQDELLEEVTSIVEWPEAMYGKFDDAFLSVPKEALISAMQDHQRYFPVVDNHNQLMPYFIAISNIASENLKNVIKGNENVLRARLSDAAFFFETDKKMCLEERVEKLKTIIFQNKLGTLYDKSERIKKLASWMAKQTDENIDVIERAALLSKTDLTTELVGEFPELQGVAGYYYALQDKESEQVATCLKEQYMPRFSGDLLPTTIAGCILALSDRVDTITGVFGINQAPTGDKDPFGLRRAALGILRILIEKKLNLDLKDLISHSVNSFHSLENKNVEKEALNFILERLKPWYQEQNIHTNVIASVMSLHITKPYDIHCRIQAVMDFKNRPEADSLSTANKRVSNILAKSTNNIETKTINPELFETEAERELVEKLEEQEKKILEFSQSTQYSEILKQLASLRAPIDYFFDHVMVMVDDKARRENRLLILKKLRQLFLQVADIALLQ